MTRYTISEDAGSLAIKLTEVGGHQQELLGAFGECQEGRCSCPTDEYEKVAAMQVRPTGDAIVIRLEPRPGSRFETSEIDACLRYTLERVSG